jgi:hypothetical protein
MVTSKLEQPLSDPNKVWPKSFLERIVNKNFQDPNIKFQEYWVELQAQMKECRSVRMEMKRIPFRGSVDVPFTTGSKNCKLVSFNSNFSRQETIDIGHGRNPPPHRSPWQRTGFL